MKKIKATCSREELTVWQKVFEFPDDATDEEISQVIGDDLTETDNDPAWLGIDGKTLDLDWNWEEIEGTGAQAEAPADTGTFHQAIDGCIAHLNKNGKKDSHGNLVTRVYKCVDRLRYLKNHHPDLPLRKLDIFKLEVITNYWRHRPPTRNKDRCSWDHANDMIKEFWRFLRWLDSRPNYRWLMPRGADQIKRSPIRFEDDTLADVLPE